MTAPNQQYPVKVRVLDPRFFSGLLYSGNSEAEINPLEVTWEKGFADPHDRVSSEGSATIIFENDFAHFEPGVYDPMRTEQKDGATVPAANYHQVRTGAYVEIYVEQPDYTQSGTGTPEAVLWSGYVDDIDYDVDTSSGGIVTMTCSEGFFRLQEEEFTWKLLNSTDAFGIVEQMFKRMNFMAVDSQQQKTPRLGYNLLDGDGNFGFSDFGLDVGEGYVPDIQNIYEINNSALNYPYPALDAQQYDTNYQTYQEIAFEDGYKEPSSGVNDYKAVGVGWSNSDTDPMQVLEDVAEAEQCYIFFDSQGLLVGYNPFTKQYEGQDGFSNDYGLYTFPYGKTIRMSHYELFGGADQLRHYFDDFRKSAMIPDALSDMNINWSKKLVNSVEVVYRPKRYVSNFELWQGVREVPANSSVFETIKFERDDGTAVSAQRILPQGFGSELVSTPVLDEILYDTDFQLVQTSPAQSDMVDAADVDLLTLTFNIGLIRGEGNIYVYRRQNDGSESLERTYDVTDDTYVKFYNNRVEITPNGFSVVNGAEYRIEVESGAILSQNNKQLPQTLVYYFYTDGFNKDAGVTFRVVEINNDEAVIELLNNSSDPRRLQLSLRGTALLTDKASILREYDNDSIRRLQSVHQERIDNPLIDSKEKAEQVAERRLEQYSVPVVDSVKYTLHQTTEKNQRFMLWGRLGDVFGISLSNYGAFYGNPQIPSVDMTGFAQYAPDQYPNVDPGGIEFMVTRLSGSYTPQNFQVDVTMRSVDYCHLYASYYGLV